MHLIKAIITSATAAIVTGLVLQAPTAELSARYAEVLEKYGLESFNLCMEAYIEACNDSPEVPAEPALTAAVPENSTAESLSDSETATQADNSLRTVAQKDVSSVKTAGKEETAAAGTESGYVVADNSSVNTTDSTAVAVSVESTSPAANNSTDSRPENAAGSSDNSNTPAATEAAGNFAETTAGLEAGNDAAAAGNTENTTSYHHTTSIYTNDESTLLRVEYYDENNKLFEYSSVSDYDKDTNSYTETVYRYDDENQVEIPMRTDTYVDGELVSSETH